MKKLIYLIIVMVVLGLIVAGCIPVVPSSEQDELGNLEIASVSKNGGITIDGVLSSGEWDAYFLGTSVTGWQGGMSVDVYGYADDTYLYAAYVADMNEPGWSVAAGLCISANLDYKTPQSASWPDFGYTHISVYGDGFAQTDGSDWDWPDGWCNTDPSVFTSRGIEYYVGEPCYGSPYPNTAEIKIPLSLLTYAGDDGQISLSGQYWQNDWAEVFYVELPPQIQICETELIAGNPKNEETDAGDVIVEYILGNDHLTVTYNTEDGWLMDEIHFHVATTPADIPQKNGNPIPGKFTYKIEDLGGVNTWPFDIPLPEGVTCGPIYFAAHAKVYKTIWASNVFSSYQGLDAKGGSLAGKPNSNPSNALGEANSTYNHPETFFSLGVDGEIVLEFDECLGGSLTIYEVTWQHPPEYDPYDLLETADVYISQDGINWALIGEATNEGQNSANTPIPTVFSLPYCIQYVKIVDTTDEGSVTFNSNGFDVDAVSIYQEETAWGEGDGFPGKNWAMYFECPDFLPECE